MFNMFQNQILSNQYKNINQYNYQQKYKKYVSLSNMSFHKLKIGSRKKDLSKPSLSNNQKLKQKNQEFINNINLQSKLQSRKANIISITDDFHQDIFKYKKPQFNTAPKTDRIHKIQRIDFPANQTNKNYHQKPYHFNYGHSQQNQQYSATQLIDFLNIKPLQTRQTQIFSSRLSRNTNANNYQSQKSQSTQQSFINKPKIQVHQIKQTSASDVENKIKNSSQIRKKIIDLDQQPLNCQIVAKQSINMNIIQRIGNQIQIQKVQKGLHQNKQFKESLKFEVSKQLIKNDVEVKQLNKIQMSKQRKQNIVIQQKQNSIKYQQTKQNPIQQTIVIKEQVKSIEEVIQKTPTIQPSNEYQTSIIQQNKQISQIQTSQLLEHKQVKLILTQTIAKTPQRVKTKNSPVISKSNPSSQKSINSPVQNIKQRTLVQSINSQSSSPSQVVGQPSPTKSKLSYKPINEVQMTILHQNKVLTQDIQKLRKQRDQLLFSNKRYEVQLMQSNCKQYYERQINRLKIQVQTLQCVQQQLRHNNLTMMNRNRQLQSSQQLSRRQIKKLLRQLQMIKIQSTRQKYQLKQKSSSLQVIIKQLQQRNNELSNKFEQYYKKYNEVQKNYKLKCQQQSNIKKLLSNLQSKLINNQKTNHDKIKHYQHEITTQITNKSSIQNQYRQFKRVSQSQMDNLRQSIKQLNLKRQSQALLISSRLKTLQKHNNNIEAQLQVVRLQQTVKQLKTQIQKRSQLIRQLNNKIDLMISMNDYEQLRKQLEQVNRLKCNMTQQYQKQNLSLTIQIQQLRNKLIQYQKLIKQKYNVLCQKSTSNSNKITDSIYQKQNFKQILKQQILQTDSLKLQLFNKSQLYYKLKQQYQDHKIIFDSLKNDQDILKKQFSTYQNNSKMKKQILQQQLVNQIQSMKRKMNVLQKRFQSKIKQNKQKQQFIQSYVIGKSSNPNDAQYLIKQMQRIFLQRQKIQLH